MFNRKPNFPPKGSMLNPHWYTLYSEIKSELKTGDLMLVQGNYPGSGLIAFLQQSPWGHVAMVVLGKDIDPRNTRNLRDGIFLWESNTADGDVANVWDNHGVKEGPMLVDLFCRLTYSAKNYDDVLIAHRSIQVAGPQLDFSKLPSFFTSVLTCTFPTNREILNSAYIGRRFNLESEEPEKYLTLDIDYKTNSVTCLNMDGDKIKNAIINKKFGNEKIYCTELIAETFKILGILTTTWVSNAYTAKDFSSDGNVRFLKSVTFGDEMYINVLE